MIAQKVLEKVKSAFPEAIVEVPELIDVTVAVRPEMLLEVAGFLHDECQMDYMADVTAVDRPERFEVVYHLYSIAEETDEPFVLKVYLEDKQAPTIPSLTHLWQGANFQECEVYDMMGIRFEGHPDLKRILLWEGFEGFPLRKDYQNRTFTYREMERTDPESA